MRVDIVTLFPEYFDGPLRASLLGKAIAAGVVEVAVHDLRRWAVQGSVDDEPYGGGAGMVMRPEPFFEAVDALRRDGSHVVLLSPRGARLDHAGASGLATRPHVVLLCGRYEGIDERVAAHAADAELSIGDYVLAGGEAAALVVIEATSRLVPGVLGNEASLASESHAQRLLEHPQYTRPVEYRGWRVPDVLLSGHHAEIDRWRRNEARRITAARRPDLVDEKRAPARGRETMEE